MELMVARDLNEAVIRGLRSELGQAYAAPKTVRDDDGEGRDCCTNFWIVARCPEITSEPLSASAAGGGGPAVALCDVDVDEKPSGGGGGGGGDKSEQSESSRGDVKAAAFGGDLDVRTCAKRRREVAARGLARLRYPFLRRRGGAALASVIAATPALARLDLQ